MKHTDDVCRHCGRPFSLTATGTRLTCQHPDCAAGYGKSEGRRSLLSPATDALLKQAEADRAAGFRDGTAGVPQRSFRGENRYYDWGYERGQAKRQAVPDVTQPEPAADEVCEDCGKPAPDCHVLAEAEPVTEPKPGGDNQVSVEEAETAGYDDGYNRRGRNTAAYGCHGNAYQGSYDRGKADRDDVDDYGPPDGTGPNAEEEGLDYRTAVRRNREPCVTAKQEAAARRRQLAAEAYPTGSAPAAASGSNPAPEPEPVDEARQARIDAVFNALEALEKFDWAALTTDETDELIRAATEYRSRTGGGQVLLALAETVDALKSNWRLFGGPLQGSDGSDLITRRLAAAVVRLRELQADNDDGYNPGPFRNTQPETEPPGECLDIHQVLMVARQNLQNLVDLFTPIGGHIAAAEEAAAKLRHPCNNPPPAEPEPEAEAETDKTREIGYEVPADISEGWTAETAEGLMLTAGKYGHYRLVPAADRTLPQFGRNPVWAEAIHERGGVTFRSGWLRPSDDHPYEYWIHPVPPPPDGSVPIPDSPVIFARNEDGSWGLAERPYDTEDGWFLPAGNGRFIYRRPPNVEEGQEHPELVRAPQLFEVTEWKDGRWVATGEQEPVQLPADMTWSDNILCYRKDGGWMIPLGGQVYWFVTDPETAGTAAEPAGRFLTAANRKMNDRFPDETDGRKEQQ